MKHSIDIEKLAERYIAGRTTRQLEAEFGVPHRTISRYLNKAGVDLRNCGATIIPQLQDKQWLEVEYLNGKSTTEIAAAINCAPLTVSVWLRRHGIETRSTGSEMGHSRNSAEECREKMSDAKRGMYIGEDNPNWKGGIAFKDPDRNRYPYKRWAKSVKERDGWTCTECRATDCLHAHHLKRWRDFPDLRYDVSNGVTLCHTCHEAAHGRGFTFRWPKHAETSTSASVPTGI